MVAGAKYKSDVCDECRKRIHRNAQAFSLWENGIRFRAVIPGNNANRPSLTPPHYYVNRKRLSSNFRGVGRA